MESGIQSVLGFDKYIVKEVSYFSNEEYVKTDKIKLDLDFDTDTTIRENGKKMEIELRTNVFKNSVAKNYPFEMYVCIKGYFSVDRRIEGIEISTFEANAIAILFPYLRAIVSTYTATSNVAPVILPAMNINAYLDRKRKTV